MCVLQVSSVRADSVLFRHAELLHFIAQKESKCLELRSQLAMHEAELLQRTSGYQLLHSLTKVFYIK